MAPKFIVPQSIAPDSIVPDPIVPVKLLAASSLLSFPMENAPSAKDRFLAGWNGAVHIVN